MSEPIAQGTDPVTAPEKTFTQADVDKIVANRLSRAMKGMPSEDELKAFRTWQDGREAERERWETLNNENEANKAALAQARTEIEQNHREKFLVSKGVSPEDVDYYSYKIGKMVTDELTFEKAAEQFLEDKKPTTTMRVNFAAPVGSGAVPGNANETMNALIRGAMK